jgi:hypothetical protein
MLILNDPETVLVTGTARVETAFVGEERLIRTAMAGAR